MAKKGIFITFEGPEGSGKSTHILLLARWLRSQGYRILLTREPGGTGLTRSLRQILLHTRTTVDSLAELFLYEADRAQHIAENVIPALQRGQVVLCDRYTDSTLAYQGYGRGLNVPLIRTLNRIASAGLQPNLTVLLDVPVNRGLRQATARKKGKDRLEKAGQAFHQRVRRGFLQLAAQEPRRFRIIKQQDDIKTTQRMVQQEMEKFLRKRIA